MDFTGKVMKGYLFVSPIGFDKDVDLDFWIETALAYNVKAKKSVKKIKR